jgi:uncharacterized protein (TIGR03437 family)
MFKSFVMFALLAFWTFAPADGQSLSFLRPQYFRMASNTSSAVTGDFNRDGKMDIAIAQGASGVTVLLGNGDGSFKRIETAQGPTAGVFNSVVAAADFNSDGIVDLLVVGSGKGYLSAVAFGNGDGTFRPPVVVDPGPSDFVIAVADFNGDGKPDLLVTAYGTGFGVRLGNGDGTFQPVGLRSQYPPAFLKFPSTVVGDFNHDGKLDVVDRTSDGVYLWLGDGRGGFAYTPKPVQIDKDPGIENVGAGDFNRDGNLDLVVQDGRGLTVWLGKGDGTFQTGPISYLDQYGRLTVADVNGDGIPDVISGFSVLLGNGDGSFQAPVMFGQSEILATADFNRDGKLDFVTGGLAVLINNTPGADSSFAAVNAATQIGPVAPGSIASIFGKGLAATTASAAGAPWPTVLDNVRVLVLDATGVERPAGIAYISPTQINFQVPPDTLGDSYAFAIVNVDNGGTPFIAGARPTQVQLLAAGFFTADGTGTGVVAATALRVQGDARTPVPVSQCSSGSCTAVPIDLNLDGAVYLSVYGTGFRDANLPPQCYITNTTIPVTYSGPQQEFPGLDQLNVVLPNTLPHGKVNITCRFDRIVPRSNSTVPSLEARPSPRDGDFNSYNSMAVFTIYTK